MYVWLWHLSWLSKHEKPLCFSLENHFVHFSVIFISQDSLHPELQDIRRDIPYLSASSPSIFATIYLSINQSINHSFALLALSIQLPRHFKATTGIIVLFCGHCVKALDQRGTSALPTYYKTCPSAPLLSLLVWAFMEDRSRGGAT